jgi:hypothetical protein
MGALALRANDLPVLVVTERENRREVLLALVAEELVVRHRGASQIRSGYENSRPEPFSKTRAV